MNNTYHWHCRYPGLNAEALIRWQKEENLRYARYQHDIADMDEDDDQD